ncbi:MAG TPA: hypothetical protein VF522_19135 [Ramlibacter sp.]|uniref:hypothetical protein n=1 Tax=Ramlibacter sp. TaxID=1917967 RepID=UPI002ED0B273
MAFDVEAARKAGYSDAEIADYLASGNKFDAKKAREAGYTDSELIAHLAGKTDLSSQIPVEKGANTTPTGEKPTTITEKLVGAGEAALSTVTGLTGGAVGSVAGTAAGMAREAVNGQFGTPEAADRIEQTAANAAQALTYSPRTESGQQQAQVVGKALEATIPVVPLAPQLAAAGQAASAAAPVAANVARAGTAATREFVKQKVLEAAARRAQAANDPAMSASATGTFGADSVGAARVPEAAMRRQAAEELGFTGNSALTRGQAERAFEQQRFEQEIAKDPTKGQAIRDRAANQHAQVWGRFDQWVDETGATKFTPGEVGDAVKGAIRDRAARDKAEIRVAFKEADKSPEAQAAVNPGKQMTIGAADDALTSSPIEFLNSKPTGLKTTALSDHARKYAVRLGIADEVDGQLVPLPTTVKKMHEWRKEINAATGFEPAEIMQATVLKKLIDAQTNEVAGPLYQSAYKLRSRYAQNYENIGLVYDLMNNKRGMSDAKVAAENVFQRSVLNASMAEVKQLRRILQTGGEDGKQAWRELQGATIRHIREEASRNISRNERGQEMVSVKGLDSAVSSLDKTGKLDFIFGKRGAEQVRALNDLSKVLFTAPPGAVNTSNTASVILAALDIATSGIAGMPLPVMSGLRILTTHVRDRQIQRRINEALGIKPEPKRVRAPQSVLPRPTADASRVPPSRTVH